MPISPARRHASARTAPWSLRRGCAPFSPNAPADFSLAQVAAGRDWFLHAGCAARHGPQEKPEGAEQAAFDAAYYTLKRMTK